MDENSEKERPALDRIETERERERKKKKKKKKKRRKIRRKSDPTQIK